MVLELPYNRPRLLEIHEQQWTPAFLRRPVQDMLTTLWITRIWPVQSLAPYEAVADKLQQIIQKIEAEDERTQRRGGQQKDRIRVVDCCSGAGGPMPEIEKRLNQSRRTNGLHAIPVLLSDIHPHPTAWESLAATSPSKSLSFVPYSVDATRAPRSITQGRHFRTFCLAFHHFDEQSAVRVLEDAMRTSEGLGIFELQEPDLGSLLTITGIFPVSWVLTLFQKPSFLTLIFTYIIPLIPIILVLDGYVSAYRTRSVKHVRYLADVAARNISRDGDSQAPEWIWESGRVNHTWPGGNMSYIVGRKASRGR